METSNQVEPVALSPLESSIVQTGKDKTSGRLSKAFRLLYALTLVVTLSPILYQAVTWRLIDDVFWVVIPLFLLTVAVSAMRARREPLEGYKGRQWLVLCLYSIAMPLLAFAYLIASSWLTLLVTFILALAMTIRLSAKTRSSDYLGVLVLMALVVWVPFGIGLGIQRIVTDLVYSVTSVLFDMLGWAHRREGSFISFSDFRLNMQLLVEGYISLVSILYITGLVAFLNRRKFVHFVLMMVAGLLIVWVSMSLRMLVVSAVAMEYGIYEWTGWLRWLLELGSFLLVALLALGADQFLAGIFGKIKLDGEFAFLRDPRIQRFTEKWNAISSFDLFDRVRRLFTKKSSGRKRWLAFCGRAFQWCLVLPVLSLSLLSVNSELGEAGISFLKGPELIPEKELTVLGVEAYKPSIEGWSIIKVESSRRDSQSLFGEFSETWTLKKDNLTVLLSVDYAFDVWHDVKECYMGKDWQIRSEEIVPSLFNPGWDVSQTRMLNDEGRPSLVFCSHSSFLGKPLQSGPVKLVPKLKYRLLPVNWGRPYDVVLTPEDKTRYQFQLISSSDRVISEAERVELQKVYEDFREQLRQTLSVRAKQ